LEIKTLNFVSFWKQSIYCIIVNLGYFLVFPFGNKNANILFPFGNKHQTKKPCKTEKPKPKANIYKCCL